jgi:2-phosphoglycerate kinase
VPEVILMNKLKKRSGELEEFSAAKLKESLARAGASEDSAKRVTEIIARNLREGMESAEVRRMAATELGRMEPAAAERYEAFTKR